MTETPTDLELSVCERHITWIVFILQSSIQVMTTARHYFYDLAMMYCKLYAAPWQKRQCLTNLV